MKFSVGCGCVTYSSVTGTCKTALGGCGFVAGAPDKEDAPTTTSKLIAKVAQMKTEHSRYRVALQSIATGCRP